jgi:HAD superfamily hydrolase (TIGR01509 family)
MTGGDELAELLYDKWLILLDFDGPICSIFAGLPAPTVAGSLRDILTVNGSTPPQPWVDDPLAVLRYTHEHAPHLVRLVDQTLRAAELEAAASATPTPGADDVLRACHDTKRHVSIVSNNSTPAIEAYLNRVGLAGFVQAVHGRPAGVPTAMKPNPQLVEDAQTDIGMPAEHCVLIGDSATDIEAAHAAATSAIGYANKPRKTETLHRADALITNMGDLARALRAGIHPDAPPPPYRPESTFIVMCATPAGWKFSLRTDESVACGSFGDIANDAPFDEAAAAAERLFANTFDRTVSLRWTPSDKPNWWTGEPDIGRD